MRRRQSLWACWQAPDVSRKCQICGFTKAAAAQLHFFSILLPEAADARAWQCRSRRRWWRSQVSTIFFAPGPERPRTSSPVPQCGCAKGLGSSRSTSVMPRSLRKLYHRRPSLPKKYAASTGRSSGPLTVLFLSFFPENGGPHPSSLAAIRHGKREQSDPGKARQRPRSIAAAASPVQAPLKRIGAITDFLFVIYPLPFPPLRFFPDQGVPCSQNTPRSSIHKLATVDNHAPSGSPAGIFPRIQSPKGTQSSHIPRQQILFRFLFPTPRILRSSLISLLSVSNAPNTAPQAGLMSRSAFASRGSGFY